MRALIIDNQNQKRPNTELCLTSLGFEFYTAEMDDDAIEFARQFEYDLIVMNADLKEPTSLQILKKLRSCKIQTPVLLYTEKLNSDTEVLMLNNGADEYLALSNASKVIVARAHALVRRSKGQAESSVRFGLLLIDIINRTVTYGDKSAKFYPFEYKLLETFVLNVNKVVSRETFLNKIYGERDSAEHRIVDVHVSRLRKSLIALSGGVNYIETVRGAGYRFTFKETSAKKDSQILKAA